MKAIVQPKYGSPDILRLTEVDNPTPAAGEVLVRVRAASMHADVWHVVSGRPFILRLMGAGLRRPKNPIPGTDIAGTVETCGSGVARFSPGDDVFGEIIRGHQWRNGGAFAEYAAVPADLLAVKPPNISFEEAAAAPTSALIGLKNVGEAGGVDEGDRVLVNGAGGGVGLFVMQIAAARGARVTGVDSTAKLDTMRAAGADAVIDYKQQDFTTGDERYDLVVDIPGNRSFSDLKRILAEGGRYVFIGHDHYGDTGSRWIGPTLPRMLKLEMTAPFGRRTKSDKAVRTDQPDPLETLRDLLESEQIRPVIDRTFPLEQTVEALRYLMAGVARGKIVITM
jgi:NADPH:quinone reductase-like Zn-dependent oxidoreductase